MDLQIFGVQKHSIGFCFKWIEYFVYNVHILKLDQNTSLNWDSIKTFNQMYLA